MRVLFVSNLYPPEVLGGYEILCAHVVETFARRGHECAVLTTPVSGASASSAGSIGPAGERLYRSLTLYLPFGESARLARAARQKVERPNRRAAAAAMDDFRPDIVFVWSQLRLGLGAAREAERRGCPVVYTMNDDHILGFRPIGMANDAMRDSMRDPARGSPAELLRYAIRSFLERAVFPASTWRGLAMDRVLAISETVRSHLARVAPRFASAEIAMQGIPLERFPCKEDPGAAHAPFRVLYAGQIHRYKGVHTLVEAAALAGPSIPGGIELRIAGAGDPDYERELRERCAALNLDARFLGRVPSDRMGAAYRDADLLAFTSVWDEPFGLTHLEAMASGTPVASVSHGGPGEFLRDGVDSLLFGKEDAPGLARCIRSLATDEALRRRIAREGRLHVEREFSIERYADRLEAALLARLARGAGTDARAGGALDPKAAP